MATISTSCIPEKISSPSPDCFLEKKTWSPHCDNDVTFFNDL